MILSLGIPGTETLAQKKSENFSDTLITGGFYTIVLTNEKKITGELSVNEDSIIVIQTESGGIFRINKSRIKSIRIAKSDFDESKIEELYSEYDEIKFNLLSSFQAGVNFPTGNLGNTYKIGYGIQMTAYHLFDRTIGMGAEFQWNNFPGSSYTDPYFFNSTDTWDSYNLFMLKMNFIAGNLNPENKIVLYGLFGFGVEYLFEGDRTHTNTYLNETNVELYPQEESAAFVYGLGIGGFYKISKKFGINCEIKFDKVPEPEYDYYFTNDSGLNGYFSIKVGIMYTKF